MRRSWPWWRSALFDLMVCGLVGVLVFAGHNQTPTWLTLTAVPMTLALSLRRRYPLSVMAVVALTALAQVVFITEGDPQRPFNVAVVIAMYSVVKYGRRNRDAWLAAAVVAVGIAIETSKQTVQNRYALPLTYTGFSVALWLTAYVVRNRRRHLAAVEERAATLEREREHLARIAVADERAAIARELHDVVAHSLAVMIVQADGGRYAFDADPAQARAALETVAATGREALADMRRLVGVLRGSTPGGSEEPAERRTGLGQLTTFADRARSAGLAVDLSVRVTDAELPPAVALTAVRIVQEALTNTLRHAGPEAQAQVSLTLDGDTLVVSCVDDGVRVAPPQLGSDGPGHGLVGMRERVSVHSGALEVGRRLDGGWRVCARIPLRPSLQPAAGSGSVAGS